MQRWIRGWLVAVIAGLGVMVGSPTLASVNLPIHHWTYEAIERLTAMGVIDQAIVVPKPYSRKEAAKYVARAIQRIRDKEVPADGREAVAEPLLDRLISELRPELSALKALPDHLGRQQESRKAFRWGGHVQVEADAFFVGKQTVRLRENRMGQYYANGPQVQSDLRTWLELTDALAINVNPKFISNAHALGIGATNNTQNVYMQELNAKFTVFNIAIEVGRGTHWWGTGYRGSLLLTDHAFPLDMIQVGSDEAFRLPGPLSGIGQWKVNTFLTQLERDRDFPRAKVFGLRISYLPASWLELGFTRMTQFNGRGRNQPFPQTVINAYINQPNQSGENQVNEQAMLDFRVRIPSISYLVPFPGGMQFYGEIGSEDKWSQFPLPNRAAVLGGIYIPQMFAGDSMDFRIEFASTDLARQKSGESNVWYNNGTYASGMRYRGFPLGHWMGTDGTDLFIRTTRHFGDNVQLGANAELSERARALPVHETKQEAAVDVTWWYSRQTRLTGGYTFQRIQNPGQITSINPFTETFAQGITSFNNFLWITLTKEF